MKVVNFYEVGVYTNILNWKGRGKEKRKNHREREKRDVL